MGTSDLRRRPERNAARRDPLRRARAGAEVAAWICFGALTIACASAPVAPDTIEALRDQPLEAGALRVQLVFGAGADLDLYVTDPDLETVYYANTPSRLGGALDADVRCDTAPPRVETVIFERAPAGTYRLGVDFPERCGRDDSAPFTLLIRGPGLDAVEAGEVGFGVFQPVVREIEIGP